MGRVPRIPGLERLKPLSQGTHATIFEATQTSVGRLVAVKVDRYRLVGEQEQQRFLDQAKAAGRLSAHPHILSVLDAGVTVQGLPYLIMELCSGSYADRISRAALSWVEARDVGLKIADALAYAHADGVLHGALKPANILITEFGQPVLADFDLSMLGEEDRAATTRRASIAEHPAPETSAQTTPTPAMDVYSLSYTLYALMSGEAPRAGLLRAFGLGPLLGKLRNPIRDVRDTPAEFTAVLRTGAARNPRFRPSAAELRDLLAAIGGGSERSAPAPRSRRPLAGPLARTDRVRPSDFEDTQDIVEGIREALFHRDDGDI